MFDNLKKSVEKLNKINPKSLLTGFVQSQRVHSKDYHELLNVDTELEFIADNRRLEAMVSAEIKADFPDISESSLELLTDATMHLIRKKQLQATDDIVFK